MGSAPTLCLQAACCRDGDLQFHSGLGRSQAEEIGEALSCTPHSSWPVSQRSPLASCPVCLSPLEPTLLLSEGAALPVLSRCSSGCQ